MDAVTGRGTGGGDGLLLAIDVGSTSIVLGVFEATAEGRASDDTWRTADELGVWVTQLFAHRHVDAGRVAHVVMASGCRRSRAPSA
jgi:type III pantothenate kinase